MAPHVNAFAVILANFSGINSSRAFAREKRIIALYEICKFNATRRCCSICYAAENLSNLLAAIGFKPTAYENPLTMLNPNAEQRLGVL